MERHAALYVCTIKALKWRDPLYRHNIVWYFNFGKLVHRQTIFFFFLKLSTVTQHFCPWEQGWTVLKLVPVFQPLPRGILGLLRWTGRGYRDLMDSTWYMVANICFVRDKLCGSGNTEKYTDRVLSDPLSQADSYLNFFLLRKPNTPDKLCWCQLLLFDICMTVKQYHSRETSVASSGCVAHTKKTRVVHTCIDQQMLQRYHKLLGGSYLCNAETHYTAGQKHLYDWLHRLSKHC